MTDMKLRPAPDPESLVSKLKETTSINRRQFLTFGFNAAGGVLAASLGALGFASILMPPSGSGGGDAAVKFWAKGREDEAWYGSLHLQAMTKSVFEAEAANSNVGMAGAQGVWSGMPVNVVYVPHEENKNSAAATNKPRFQYLDGYSSGGKYVGSGFEVDEKAEYSALSIHDNLVIVFSRCPHLCCIPGWQLVANDYTNDSWEAGGTESGGNKLFCICHSSRFDPTAIEKNSMGRGTPFNYIGIKKVGGPSPNGMPLVPFVLNGDMIEALPDFVDWYAYCA